MKKPVSEIQSSLKPKTARELINEIANLELELIHMERYLLSLYQKAFDSRQASLSTGSKDIEQYKVTQKRPEGSWVSSDSFQKPQDHADINVGKYIGAQEQQDILGSSIHRSHSSLSHSSAYGVIPSSSLVEKVAEAIHSYHSLPLTMLEHSNGEASNYMISNDSLQSRHTANWLSEEMVRCISAIYCKLAENSVVGNDFPSPAVSLTLSVTASPLTEFDSWSPQSKINSSLDLQSDACFFGVSQEFSGVSGPTSSEMVEVMKIYKDCAKMKEIEPMVQRFRSLVNRLERVNPSMLKHDEKLAFWINVHNALVMHAFLAYDIPQSKVKRVSLLLKAAYNVGGHTISVAAIQNYITGSRLPYPGQWFRQLFQPKKKARTRYDSKSYATDRPEPLSYFALCCGSHSDPPVRIYTPKRVFQELIAARGEYMLHSYRINRKCNKILLPKIVENYVKDSGLHPADFMGIIEQILPVNLQRNRTSSQNWHRKGWKSIGWIPHDFSFRYQFSRELLQC